MDKKGKAALSAFMVKFGNNQTAAADALGYSAPRMHQLFHGDREMSDACAARIHAVSQGQISMYDLSENLRKLANLDVAQAYRQIAHDEEKSG